MSTYKNANTGVMDTLLSTVGEAHASETRNLNPNTASTLLMDRFPLCVRKAAYENARASRTAWKVKPKSFTDWCREIAHDSGLPLFAILEDLGILNRDLVIGSFERENKLFTPVDELPYRIDPYLPGEYIRVSARGQVYVYELLKILFEWKVFGYGSPYNTLLNRLKTQTAFETL